MQTKKNLTGMSEDIRIKYTLWQMNLSLLQMYDITSLKQVGEKEAD